MVGGQAECDTDNAGCFSIPLTVSFLCDGSVGVPNCPQYFDPDRTDTTGQTFYGINNGYTPRRCVKSTNGGSVWSACTTNPFASIATGPVYFTVTPSGVLLAAGRTAANFCEIKRSNDQGATWTLVFSSVAGAVACNNTASNTPGGSLLKCIPSGTYCVLLAANIFTTGTWTPITSTDSGATWTTETGLVTNSTDAVLRSLVLNDFTGLALGLMTTTTRSLLGLEAWSVSTAWSTLPVSEFCTGIIRGSLSAICSPDAANEGVYTLRDSEGGLQSSFTMTNAPGSASSPLVTAVSISSTVGYVLGREVPGTTRYNIWVTTNTFGDTALLTSITPTTYFTSCCVGDMLFYNGSIYMTSGGIGSGAQFIKIS